MKVKRTTGQRAFLLHMLSGVVFLASIATVANSANMQVSWGVRSLVFIYFSIASKDIQSAVTAVQLLSNYEPSVIHHFALESRLEESEIAEIS